MSMCNNEFVNFLFIYFFIDRISNSQTSEPIGSSKSPIVDLVGEDLEVE